jgi:hypothetical protein
MTFINLNTVIFHDYRTFFPVEFVRKRVAEATAFPVTPVQLYICTTSMVV